MTNLRQVLALNMKEKRSTIGISQAKLAEKINTAPTYIAMIELGKKFPSVEMLEKIASALFMDTTELFWSNLCRRTRLENYINRSYWILKK